MAGIKVKDIPQPEPQPVADESAQEHTLARGDFVPGLESLIERAGPVELKVSIPLQEQKAEPAAPPPVRPKTFTFILVALLAVGLGYLLLSRKAPIKGQEADEDCVDCDKAPKGTYTIEQLMGLE